MRLCELRQKEVINLCTCKRLGHVEDLIFDLCKGCIEAIVVPERVKFCSFFGSECEFIIPLECVKKVGEDFIMVEINEDKYLKNSRE
jgi:YlmC/YmxH family sporulation protein